MVKVVCSRRSCGAHIYLELTWTIVSLCRITNKGGQKLGSGRRSISPPARTLIVCRRNESLSPCKKIASSVLHIEFVHSDNFIGSLSKTKDSQSTNYNQTAPLIKSPVALSLFSYCISFTFSENSLTKLSFMTDSRLSNVRRTELKNEFILISSFALKV